MLSVTFKKSLSLPVCILGAICWDLRGSGQAGAAKELQLSEGKLEPGGLPRGGQLGANIRATKQEVSEVGSNTHLVGPG